MNIKAKAALARSPNPKKDKKGKIRYLNNRSLVAHNRTESMTETFLDRITLSMQFFKRSF
jgi:hypothetical protein